MTHRFLSRSVLQVEQQEQASTKPFTWRSAVGGAELDVRGFPLAAREVRRWDAVIWPVTQRTDEFYKFAGFQPNL
jgi:hypothetical protein